MAGKGRRVASRQAQLGRRRKRQGRGPGEETVVTGGVKPSQGQVENSATTAVTESETAANPPRRQLPRTAVVQPAPVSAARRPGRARAELPTAYAYVGSKLRRIFILSAAVLGILIVLSVVLKL